MQRVYNAVSARTTHLFAFIFRFNALNMYVEPLGDLEDEASPADITLAAQKPRRKSTRRSMVVFPTSARDSPVSYSSPKVLVRRHTLGRNLLNQATASPIPRTPLVRHSLSFMEERKCFLQALPLENSPQPDPPTTPLSKMTTEIHDCDKTPTQEPDNATPAKRPKIEVAEDPVPASNAATAASSSPPLQPIVESVDALLETYERELAAWPEFLARLQEDATTPLQIPQMTRDDVANNPVLGHFIDFIFPRGEALDARALQNRIQAAMTSAQASLIRLHWKSRNLRPIMINLQRQAEAERSLKLRKLLPNVNKNPEPFGGKELLAFYHFLREENEPEGLE